LVNRALCTNLQQTKIKLIIYIMAYVAEKPFSSRKRLISTSYGTNANTGSILQTSTTKPCWRDWSVDQGTLTTFSVISSTSWNVAIFFVFSVFSVILLSVWLLCSFWRSLLCCNTYICLITCARRYSIERMSDRGPVSRTARSIQEVIEGQLKNKE